ncbi:unnamed protein product [Musa hybrid cultivar]
MQVAPISNICKLQILCLRSVPIHDVLANLEMVFSGCLRYSMEELDLSNTHLSGSFPDWLGNIKNLKSLNLSFNSLYRSVPASIGNLSLLQHLVLCFNDLNGTISEGIGQLKSLVYLDLNSNSLSLSEIQLANLSSLRYLDISSNCNSRKNGAGVIDMILDGLPSSLEYLDLSHNSLNGSLPASLGNFLLLHSLILSSNYLTGMLPEGIKWLKGLVRLNLCNNSLRLSEDDLANLSSLKYLEISHNSIQLNKSGDWIPPFQLNTLYIGFCQILPVPHFPKWLRTQNTLCELDLSNTGIEETIPNWLSSNLRYLYLSNNKITGKVPQFFPKLKYLILSNNSFSGDLPPRISNTMPRLQWLDLSMNNLSGGIPFSYCRSRYLEGLLLSENNLSGGVPNCWKNPSNLLLLDLSSNKLVGGIPDSVCNLQTLESLHLRRNNLSGPIPLCLKSCTELVTLDLGHNNFIGNIPTWIGESLLYLKTLSLRSNAFTGSIPQLSSLASLRILDFSNNNLSGIIPRSFGNFSALKGTRTYHCCYFNNNRPYEEVMWLFVKGSEI